MRVLVTGGRGFLGHAVTLALLDDGHQVDVLSRSAERGKIPGAADVLAADIADRAAVRHALADRVYEGVVHAAALTNGRESFAQPIRYFDVNVGGTANLLAALADQDGPAPGLVYTSTNTVYGSIHAGQLREEQEPHPESPYAASKLAAEQLVAYHARTGAIGAVTLRVFNIAGAVDGVGDGDPSRLIPAVLSVAAGARTCLTVNGAGDAVREYTHVRDVAHAVRLAIPAARPGSHRVYNVGTGDGATVLDLVAAAEHITGRPIALEHGPSKPEPHVLVADARRIKEELGWSPKYSGLCDLLSDAWAARVFA